MIKKLNTVQWAVLFCTPALILAFMIWPAQSLPLFWNVVIPLLPITFLFSPIVWRTVCPLASLNMLTNRAKGSWKLSVRALPSVSALGLVLLALLVPARRFLLNENGMALAILVIGLSVLALFAGRLFEAKAGFCNSICPLLSVEKLYGQHPIAKVKNPRCPTCSRCTPKGCIDLSPEKALTQGMDKRRQTPEWLTKPYGLFAAVFPGYVIAYFTMGNVPYQEAPSVYLHFLAWGSGSLVFFAYWIRLFRIQATYALPVLGGLALTLYYWFVAPQIAVTLSMADLGTAVVRTTTITLVVLWVRRALIREWMRNRPFVASKMASNSPALPG